MRPRSTPVVGIEPAGAPRCGASVQRGRCSAASSSRRSRGHLAHLVATSWRPRRRPTPQFPTPRWRSGSAPTTARSRGAGPARAQPPRRGGRRASSARPPRAAARHAQRARHRERRRGHVVRARGDGGEARARRRRRRRRRHLRHLRPPARRRQATRRARTSSSAAAARGARGRRRRPRADRAAAAAAARRAARRHAPRPLLTESARIAEGKPKIPPFYVPERWLRATSPSTWCSRCQLPTTAKEDDVREFFKRDGGRAPPGRHDRDGPRLGRPLLGAGVRPLPRGAARAASDGAAERDAARPPLPDAAGRPEQQVVLPARRQHLLVLRARRLRAVLCRHGVAAAAAQGHARRAAAAADARAPGVAARGARRARDPRISRAARLDSRVAGARVVARRGAPSGLPASAHPRGRGAGAARRGGERARGERGAGVAQPRRGVAQHRRGAARRPCEGGGGGASPTCRSTPR